MKSTIFTGAATAIITPFNETGVDWDTFGRLIESQLAGGISAIVAAQRERKRVRKKQNRYEKRKDSGHALGHLSELLHLRLRVLERRDLHPRGVRS